MLGLALTRAELLILLPISQLSESRSIRDRTLKQIPAASLWSSPRHHISSPMTKMFQYLFCSTILTAQFLVRFTFCLLKSCCSVLSVSLFPLIIIVYPSWWTCSIRYDSSFSSSRNFELPTPTIVLFARFASHLVSVSLGLFPNISYFFFGFTFCFFFCDGPYFGITH